MKVHPEKLRGIEGLRARMIGREHECAELKCVSIGQPISYWPFLDILRTYFGFSEDDTEAERAQKVRSRVEKLLPDRLDDMLPFLGHLMNLGFGGEIDRFTRHVSADGEN